MDIITIVFLAVQAFIFGGFCSYIAKEKNRNSDNWFLLGLFFSIIALIAIAGLHPLEKNDKQIKE